MTYFITFLIIFINASFCSIFVKKRIEETMPISIVGMILVIYITGLFDNLRLGVILVNILTIIETIIMLFYIVKQDKLNNMKEVIRRIITPGLLVYTILYLVSVILSKGRIFEVIDEFNHWGLVVKNMFMYNTYGTNAESVITYNEYPPFTAIFQFLFIAIQRFFSEDTIIIAHNVLYFSIIIPILKNIKWDKSLFKLFNIIPLIIFVPMILYRNFFFEILVDGILGIMFAYVIFSAMEEEQDFKWKCIKILAGEIMLCLTKSTGIALAFFSVIVIFIKIFCNRKFDKNLFIKELKMFSIMIAILFVVLVSWGIKVNKADKEWDLKQIVKLDEIKELNKKSVINAFVNALFIKNEFTEKNLTVCTVLVVMSCIQFLIMKRTKEKNYKFYTIAMYISIPIYLFGLLIAYISLFTTLEADILACFERYVSTIMLAFIIFQMFVFVKINDEKYLEKVLVIISILLVLIPSVNIQKKYINGKNYISTAKGKREAYTKLGNYRNNLGYNDKILMIVDDRAKDDFFIRMNEYEILPSRLSDIIYCDFETQENFEDVVKKYDYVFIYRIDDEIKERIKGSFDKEFVRKDTLYKVNVKDENVILEMERIKID